VAGHRKNRPVRQSMKTRNWASAERELERWLEEDFRASLAAKGEQVPAGPEIPAEPSSNLPLTEAIDKYIAKVRLKKRTASTITSYSKTLSHLAEFLEQRKITGVGNFRLADLDDFQQTRREVSPKTMRKEVEHLRAFCAFCTKRKWIAEDYAKDLEAPDDDNMPTLPFEGSEIHRLLDACAELDNANPKYVEYARKRMEALILTLCYTGLRISDAAALDRSRLLANGVPGCARRKPLDG
jgi:site-specific recombinase XerD